MNGSGVPEISVLIPCYNYGQYVGRAIQSVLDQNVPGLEVVVVDDASTDNTWDVVSAIAAADSRVRVFHNDTNLGLGENCARLMELSAGKRISFLSADDYLLPGHLHRLLAVHAEHPEIDYVFTPYFRVDANERVIDYIGHVGHLRGSYFGGRNEFASLLTYDCYTNLATTMFLREELFRVGLEMEFAASDYHLFLRLARDGKKLAFLDVPGVCFRAHGSNISADTNYIATGKQLLEQIIILERHLLPENEALISGHERGIGRLVQAKVNNLQSHPEAAAKVLHELRPRIDAIIERLNSSLRATDERAVPSRPRISVVLACAGDLNAAAETIQSIQNQTYTNFELIVVSDTPFAAMPFFLDRARGSTLKHVAHRSPQPRPVAMNDGVRLATGDVVTYAEPGSLWPIDHLERIARGFTNQNIEALVVPATIDGDQAGSPLASQAAIISEAVPLWALAHLHRVLDRVGLFQESLPHLSDAEFVFRVMSGARVGVDMQSPVELRRAASWQHPALADPSGYISSLRAIYQAHQPSAAIGQQREAHFLRVSRELERAVGAADAGRNRNFVRIARGLSSD